MKRVIPILACLLFTSILFSQKGNYVRYSIEEGLPSNQVYDIIQDDNGFLWFSTDRGLSRYDGFTFENFTIEDGLTNNVVFDFHKQENGDIWCTTLSSELFKIVGDPPQFIPHEYNSLFKENCKGQVPYSVFIPEEGGIYMSFLRTIKYLHINNNGEVLTTPELWTHADQYESLRCMLLKKNTSESFFFLDYLGEAQRSNGQYDFLPEKGVRSVRDEALYFRENKVSVFLATDKIIIRSDCFSKEHSLNENCIASGKLDENYFWIGLDGGGGQIYDLNGRLIQSFLNDYSVTQIFKDSENNIWISTLSSGVYLQRNSDLKLMSPLFENDYYVNDLGKDCDGNLYVGYYNGNISRFSEKEGLISFHKASIYCPALITHDEENCVNYFYFEDRLISSDSSVNLFLTCRNIYSYQDEMFLINDNTIVKNRDGLSHYIFKETRIYDIQFFNDRYYAGAENGLLFIKDGIEGKVRENEVFFANPIRTLDCIYSYLIVGTKGDGVGLMDARGEVILNLKTEDGLSGNFISNLFVENDSVFWVCTNAGLSKVILQKNLEYEIVNMNPQDGRLKSGVDDIEIINNTLWIGTRNGLYYMDKDDFGVNSRVHNSSKLLLNAILYDTVMLSNNSILSSSDSIEFRFQAISFRDNVKPRYRYKLSEKEKDWKYTSDQHVSYENLGVGDYTFYIQFCNSNECWSDTEKVYTFSISNPFYWTWWMNFIPITILGGLFYLFYRNRTSHATSKELEVNLKEEEERSNTILIKHLGALIKLNTSSILFVKSSGNYLEFHTPTRKYLTRMGMNDFFKEIPKPDEFVRVHKSYSVRLDKIDQKTSQKVWIHNQEIPIGRVYKGELSDAEAS